MTDKEKLEKIKSLADKMSDTAFNITTDASLLKKAMDEYHQFIINEYHKEEQIIKKLQEEPVSEELEEAVDEYAPDFSNSIASKAAVDAVRDAFKAGAQWQKEKDDEEKVLIYKHGFEDCKEQIMTNAIDSHCFGFQGAALFSFRLPADKYLVGSKVKIFVIKED